MNVFVVEDSAAVRRLMVRRLVGLAEIQVVGEAAGEVEALSKIEGLDPDVVLLDFSLAAGGSGFHVLKQLRLTGYLGKILMVSSQEAYSEACVQAGADGFYDKASGLETLFDDLSSLAHRRLPPDTRLASTWHDPMTV